jgi:hypothetical protein|tara:strand:- start:75 stop:515 length:441 start_codon:yes stop_codon:yes gene_type:complete
MIDCFPANTRITMADGSKREIHKISAGDIVLSYDPITKELTNSVVGVVQERSSNRFNDIYTNHSILTSTLEHPFFVFDEDREYELKSVKSLKDGNFLLNENNKLEPIFKIQIDHSEEYRLVYNLLNVGEFNNFFAEGILVHNAKTK